MQITDYNELINSTLDEDFEFLFAAEDPPSPDQIASFEIEVGCSLPDDFKVLLGSYLNGFYAEAKEEVWPRKQGGAHWMFQYALVVYGLDSGLPDWINLRNQIRDFREQSNTNLIPFMRTISSSEPYCFTSSGAITKWNNDSNEAQSIDASFFEVFESELVDLQNLKVRAVNEKI